jgi:hypothetical protein
LTIVLPDFGKAIEKSLDRGWVARTDFGPNWGFHQGVPKFLSGFLKLVFDPRSGVLLDEPSVEAIIALRQFSLAFGKMKLLCHDDRISTAKEQFLECELEVRRNDRNLGSGDLLDFKRLACSLWGDSLAELDRRIFHGEFLPKHGNGSTADRVKGNQKFDLRSWTDRLERVVPFYEYARFSYREFFSDGGSVDFHEPGAEIPVRVIAVPKTQKTPRLIAMEPAHMQYVQQALLEQIKQVWREFTIPASFVNFDSQLPNQRMARQGSIDGSLATLDLSEASDRVSYQHVLALLDRHTLTREFVDACRSRKADVDGKVIRLAKFASMGSALCFPFEAMVFLTVVFLGIQKSLGHQLSRKEILSFRGSVRVYGDDIVVPVDHVESVRSALEAFGFKVNTNKSFWTGKFRESCGKDYYDGYDVSVTRVRSYFPTNRSEVHAIEATVSLRNQLAQKGIFPDCVSWLDEMISSIIPFPKVLPSSPILGRHDLDGSYDSDRVHPKLQHPIVKGAVVKATHGLNSIDGYVALLKMALKRGPDPFEDSEHLLYSGRPQSANIKLRWARPY